MRSGKIDEAKAQDCDEISPDLYNLNSPNSRAGDNPGGVIARVGRERDPGQERSLIRDTRENPEEQTSISNWIGHREEETVGRGS